MTLALALLAFGLALLFAGWTGRSLFSVLGGRAYQEKP